MAPLTLPASAPAPVPAYGPSDHRFAGRETLSLGPYASMVVESARAPWGGGFVRTGGVARPDAGDVGSAVFGVGVGVEVEVEVDEVEVGAGVGAGFSAGTYMPPSSVLPSGDMVCRRSLTRSVPAP